MTMQANTPKIRRAVMRQLEGRPALETIQRYLYANYTARLDTADKHLLDLFDGEPIIVIEGVDDHGFTLDAIIDRLHSGMHFAREVTDGE